MRAAASAALALGGAQAAPAQTKDISSIMSGMSSKLKTAGVSAVDVILIVIGFVGVIMCVPTLIKYIKGDPTASDGFLKLGFGIIIVVGLIEIIKQYLLS